MTDQGIYRQGFLLTAVLVFLGSWGYCVLNYGFLIGVGLGWIPAAITALVIAAIWPFVLLVLAGVTAVLVFR